MNITLLSADKLKVSLNGQDVRDLDIDLKNAGCVDGKNRIFFTELLSRGKRETGFSPKGAKVFVEVYPGEDGGCVIYFTAFDKVQYPRKLARLEPVVFSFENADDLCNGAVKLFKRYSHRIYKSSLHRYNGTFHLIIYPLDYSDRLSVYFLSEYGERVGEGGVFAAHIGEYGSEIIADNALDALSEMFG